MRQNFEIKNHYIFSFFSLTLTSQFTSKLSRAYLGYWGCLSQVPSTTCIVYIFFKFEKLWTDMPVVVYLRFKRSTNTKQVLFAANFVCIASVPLISCSTRTWTSKHPNPTTLRFSVPCIHHVAVFLAGVFSKAPFDFEPLPLATHCCSKQIIKHEKPTTKNEMVALKPNSTSSGLHVYDSWLENITALYTDQINTRKDHNPKKYAWLKQHIRPMPNEHSQNPIIISTSKTAANRPDNNSTHKAAPTIKWTQGRLKKKQSTSSVPQTIPRK